MTSTPESVPEPHSRACGWRPHDHGTACHDNCPTCHGRPVPPAASSPDEGSGGVPLSVPVVRMSGSKDKWHAADDNEATSCGLPLPKGSVLAHARSLDVVNDLCGNCFDVPRLKARVAARRPASADEGTLEGCEIDPVSSRGCERGTPGCVTQHADEGTRQRPGGELVAAPSTPAPRVDRADLIERLYDANGFDDIKYHEAEVRGLLAEAADALAAAPPTPVERPQPEPGALVLGTEDRFHLWAKLYEIQQEAGLCRFGGRSYDPQLDHIYEEATTALAYFEPPAPTDGEP